MKSARPAKPEKTTAKKISRKRTEPLSLAIGKAPAELNAVEFRRRLMSWYREHARVLPWRGIHDPYATWVSEIMLQQTQVATVQWRYVEFLRRFPTLLALAKAKEVEVLAMWSGLGYYRRARMLHKAAKFVARELDGHLPETAAELRTLPGVGEYTAAAIASIAFGESIAVVDGNVQRVLLRITGHPEEKTAAGRSRVLRLAQTLMPAAKKVAKNAVKENAPGDHNQAVMELGATICLSRGPLCLECPVVKFCHTRGEHKTLKREPAKSRQVAHLLALRESGGRTEVLLEQRSQDASLMAGMFELPPLPLDATAGHTPVLRIKHAITNTMYSVQVFPLHEGKAGKGTGLLRTVPANLADLHWVAAQKLNVLPLTGLARKCLVRLGVMQL